MLWFSFLLGGISSQAPPAEHGEEFHGRIAPAEPDDPNSSALNPNKHEKLGVGKPGFLLDSPHASW